jgi:hypothetical protein
MLVKFSNSYPSLIINNRDLIPLINARLNSLRFSNFVVSRRGAGEIGTSYWTVDGDKGDWSTDQLVEMHITGHVLVLHYGNMQWVCHKDDEGELWGVVPAEAPSRTPSDILLLPEEEALLVLDGADCRWWLILENGELEDIFAQEEARPADAKACGGDWYMPWYNARNHVHGGDRDRLSWAAHMYGTRESVEKVHALVLKRVLA